MLKLLPPQPTKRDLLLKAASGTRGCVAARKALQQRVHDELRADVRKAVEARA